MMYYSKQRNSDISLAVNKQFFDVCREHLDEKKHLKPIWISPYGSMNYGTFNPKISDVDTKLIVLPSYKTLVWDAPFIKEYKLKEYKSLNNIELCTVMDIRHFTNNLLKQSINFLETLFSDYGEMMDLDFFPLWGTYFLANKELIAHYDEKACIHAACYQALHTLQQDAEHNGKKYANVLRLIDFMNKYLQGCPFSECITVSPNLLDEILTFKNGEEEPGNLKVEIARANLNVTLLMENIKFQSHPEVKEILREGTEKLIQKNLELTK